MVPSLLRFPGDVFADIDDLQRQLDRLLGARGADASIRAVRRGAFPAVNVGTTPEAVEIYAFAPGIDARSLDVTVDKGLLTISGERKGRTADGGAQLQAYARERAEGPFRRVVTLPEDADPDKVSASYRNGIVHIHVQKREASRPRRIQITDSR
ncbi:Hsp20/alpha crystallin family protein [Piscinibacter sp.]|uniref:Hsp20/alpha crystallin family protein n=1 Tax=Piscinibacter sp. TaxID=1903157 RepID=UPI002BB6AF6C|nr:Hsp20/alpha crystallin family protein [Albitalea sp.]HUG22804.1 Hsp20/alpha crystallin family protein [Albitalea sp.]